MESKNNFRGHFFCYGHKIFAPCDRRAMIFSPHVTLCAPKFPVKVDDNVTEVNGKSTNLGKFGNLLPADKKKPVKLKLVRLV